jgi:hypothetical protein
MIDDCEQAATEGRRLVLAWERFCKTVKHRRRYLFIHDTYKWADEIPVSQVLEELGAVAARRELVRKLPSETIIFRMRIRTRYERPSGPLDLGPPPIHCTVANRMSPAGISLFYGALDANTAWDETFSIKRSLSGRRRKYEYGTLAQWKTNRELRLLDLARLPEGPMLNGTLQGWYRGEVPFLIAFKESIRKPVVLDGREHLDYVPTQIICEYFQHVFFDQGGDPLDGILYPSSVRSGGTCVVLFIGHDDFLGFRPEPLPIDLLASSIRHVRK